MSFTRAKPGDWGTGEKLTSAQMNQIDLNQSRAVDGNAGGSYSPSTAITIAGQGVALDGLLHTVPATGKITVASGGIVLFNGTTGKPTLGSRALLRFIWNPISSSSEFTQGISILVCVGTTVVSAKFEFRPPNGSTLDSVTAYVRGVLSGSTMPTTMPQLSVWRRSSLDGSFAQLGSTATDTSADRTAFELLHTNGLAVSSIAHTVDNSANIYVAQITTPTGGNTAAGFEIWPPRIQFTTTAMDDGAS